MTAIPKKPVYRCGDRPGPRTGNGGSYCGRPMLEFPARLAPGVSLWLCPSCDISAYSAVMASRDIPPTEEVATGGSE